MSHPHHSHALGGNVSNGQGVVASFNIGIRDCMHVMWVGHV